MRELAVPLKLNLVYLLKNFVASLVTDKCEASSAFTAFHPNTDQPVEVALSTGAYTPTCQLDGIFVAGFPYTNILVDPSNISPVEIDPINPYFGFRAEPKLKFILVF